MTFWNEMCSLYQTQAIDAWQGMTIGNMLLFTLVVWSTGSKMITSIVYPTLMGAVWNVNDMVERKLFWFNKKETDFFPMAANPVQPLLAMFLYIATGTCVHFAKAWLPIDSMPMYWTDMWVLLDSAPAVFAAMYVKSVALRSVTVTTLLGVAYFQVGGPALLHNAWRKSYSALYGDNADKMRVMASSLENLHVLFVFVYAASRCVAMYRLVDRLAVRDWLIKAGFSNPMGKMWWCKSCLLVLLVAQSISIPMHFVPRVDGHMKTEGYCPSEAVTNKYGHVKRVCAGDHVKNPFSDFCPVMIGVKTVTGIVQVETVDPEDVDQGGVLAVVTNVLDLTVGELYYNLHRAVHDHFHGNTKSDEINSDVIYLWDPYSTPRELNLTREEVVGNCTQNMQEYAYRVWRGAVSGMMFGTLTYVTFISDWRKMHGATMKWGVPQTIFCAGLFYGLELLCDSVFDALVHGEDAAALAAGMFAFNLTKMNVFMAAAFGWSVFQMAKEHFKKKDSEEEDDSEEEEDSDEEDSG